MWSQFSRALGDVWVPHSDGKNFMASIEAKNRKISLEKNLIPSPAFRVGLMPATVSAIFSNEIHVDTLPIRHLMSRFKGSKAVSGIPFEFGCWNVRTTWPDELTTSLLCGEILEI